jgi:hypothetical protein
MHQLGWQLDRLSEDFAALPLPHGNVYSYWGSYQKNEALLQLSVFGQLAQLSRI